jgi:hypothetical protein
MLTYADVRAVLKLTRYEDTYTAVYRGYTLASTASASPGMRTHM